MVNGLTLNLSNQRTRNIEPVTLSFPVRAQKIPIRELFHPGEGVLVFSAFRAPYFYIRNRNQYPTNQTKILIQRKPGGYISNPKSNPSKTKLPKTKKFLKLPARELYFFQPCCFSLRETPLRPFLRLNTLFRFSAQNCRFSNPNAREGAF